MGLVLGVIGFGIIVIFIIFYYVSCGWVNVVFCLSVFGGCFIGVWLLFVNSINWFGGFCVVIICFGVESFGLLLLWSVLNFWVGLVGVVFIGFGFFLVFLVFGVEVVNLVLVFNCGVVLGVYLLFVDLLLGIIGLLVGFVVNLFGFCLMFFFVCLVLFGGLVLVVVLYWCSCWFGQGVYCFRWWYVFQSLLSKVFRVVCSLLGFSGLLSSGMFRWVSVWW